MGEYTSPCPEVSKYQDQAKVLIGELSLTNYRVISRAMNSAAKTARNVRFKFDFGLDTL
jgi:hypothetical protein